MLSIFILIIYSKNKELIIFNVYDINDTVTPSEQKLNPSDYFKQDPKDSYSVEHIYPQKAVNKYWKDRYDKYTDNQRKILSSSLGNLLPLSKRINSTLLIIIIPRKNPKEYFFESSRYLPLNKQVEFLGLLQAIKPQFQHRNP